MPVYKDDNAKTNKWFVKFNYTDMFGNHKQKKKRGFRTKKEALEWEQTFALKANGSPDMLFNDFVDIYLDDISKRVKPQTIRNKRIYLKNHILPYFGNMKLTDIKPLHIRKWQNDYLLAYKTKRKNTPLTKQTLKTIQEHLSSIFNYAVKFYNLPYNPLLQVGYVTIPSNKKMVVWTTEDFKKFISVVDDKLYFTLYNLLYFTGIRIGEAKALQVKDIDFKNKTLSIHKNMYLVDGVLTLGTPKTPKSNRIIVLNDYLINVLTNFIKSLYKVDFDDFIFSSLPKNNLNAILKKYIDVAGVPKITLHGFRHSHASLLIELGFAPTVIADRLGHEKVSTTLDTYSHMFEHKQNEIANKLNDIF